MITFLKRILCGLRGHSLVFLRNIYGDEIIAYGWKRSVWKCEKCGAIKAKNQLHNPSTERSNIDAATKGQK